jgi:hypothetical protein
MSLCFLTLQKFDVFEINYWRFISNIAKEVSLVSGENFMKEGGKQSAQTLLLELIEFVTMEKSTNVQHEAILDFVIDLT